MAKYRVKLAIWFLGGLLLVGGGIWFAGWVGDWAARSQRSADTASALNLPPDVPDEANSTLTWLPDDADTGREMEPLTRRQIESAYLRAWAQWNLALGRGETAGLATYFVGPGLTAVEAGVQAAADSGFLVDQRNLGHALQLHVYAADGSIVAFTDTRAKVSQAIRDGNGRVILAESLEAQYDVVMFLEDGNWRIRHWVRH